MALAPPLAAARSIAAQSRPRARWSTDAPLRTTADTSTAVVRVDIDSGWHVYSLTQQPKGPYPLRITVAGGGVQARGPVRGPRPERFPTSAFNIPVEWYTGRAEFRVPVRATASASPAALLVRYQVCSETLCLPPTTDTLAVHITSTARAQRVGVRPRDPRRAPARSTSPWVGRWEGTAHYDSVDLRFPVSISGSEARGLVVALANGVDSISSTAATLTNDSAQIVFAHLASALRLVRSGDSLGGWFGNPRRADSVRVTLRRPTRIANATGAPSIAGTWWFPAASAKGEQAWRLVVTEQATSRVAPVTATILRVDGDAGAHIGAWHDSLFVLDHFDGTRPGRLELQPLADGSLQVAQRTPRGAARRAIAWREAVAEAHGVPRPSDVATHTGVRDSTIPFAFDFPDMRGTRVRHTDTRFAGKVVLVNVTGSWCPNCHDEAPYLSTLYARYRDRGFEVVALDFEEAEQAPRFERLSAFVARYGIAYPYLIAGEPREVRAKVPQAVDLDTWPATFFLARDGTVRAVRTGFAARASGSLHDALRQDYERIIESLLGETPPPRR